MKIDFSQPILNVDGTLIMLPAPPPKPGEESPPAQPLRLVVVAVQALNHTDEKLGYPPAEQFSRRGHLAIKIGDGKEHDLTVEEVVMIKQLLRFAWSPVVAARAEDLLEGGQK